MTSFSLKSDVLSAYKPESSSLSMRGLTYSRHTPQCSISASSSLNSHFRHWLVSLLRLGLCWAAVVAGFFLVGLDTITRMGRGVYPPLGNDLPPCNVFFPLFPFTRNSFSPEKNPGFGGFYG